MKTGVVGIVSAVSILCGWAACQPVRYDQRQEGELNVRTDVEDVVLVVVPPQDLVTAGMGLVAATAADLLRKSYGGMGPERWPLRTTSKVGSVPLEKSPYKVDLEKSGLKVKKISHVGDPNRYRLQGVNQPLKAVGETKTPERPSVETASVTENKTVKKALKPEEGEEAPMEGEEKKQAEETVASTREKVREESVKVVGEGSKDGLDPSSILRIEGCGPDARRDSSGKCVFKE